MSNSRPELESHHRVNRPSSIHSLLLYFFLHLFSVSGNSLDLLRLVQVSNIFITHTQTCMCMHTHIWTLYLPVVHISSSITISLNFVLWITIHNWRGPKFSFQHSHQVVYTTCKSNAGHPVFHSALLIYSYRHTYTHT